MINDSTIKELRNKIGETHLTELTELDELKDLDCHIYAKVESSNVTGSIKDRPALEMIEEAYHKGLINSDTVIIEPTSGNMGISLAYIGKELGIKVIIVMPSSMSEERRNMIKKYGAELILVPGTMADCITLTNKLCSENQNYLLLGQFENEACINAHFIYTGQEIYDALPEINCLIAGIGTGGTVCGCGKFFKGISKRIKVIGVEPLQSPFINKGIAGPHKIQGIGAGFIPAIYKPEYVDEVMMIDDEEAIAMAKKIHEKEGIFCGITSGAALLAALSYAKKYKGKNIVVIFPDSGDRYQWN